MCPICPLSGVIVTIVCDVGVDPSVSCFINSPHQRHGRGPACLSLVLCSSSCQSMLGLTLVGEGFLSKPWSQRRPDQCLIALCVCGCCVELPGYRGAICDFVALELLRCIMVPRERGRRQVTHKRWETRHTAPSQTEDVGHRPCRHKGRQTYWTGTKTQRPKQTDGWTPPSLCVEDQTWGMLWKIYLPFPCHPSVDCIHLVHSSSEFPPPFFVPVMYADVSGLGAKPARRGCVVPACTDCFVLGEGWWQLHVCGLKTRTNRLYTVERRAVGQLGRTINFRTALSSQSGKGNNFTMFFVSSFQSYTHSSASFFSFLFSKVYRWSF